MKLYSKPEVFLVSKTKRIDYVVQEFLESIGKKGLYLETDPEVSDTDRLPEDAGRLCYLSQDNCRPGGNKAYLDHIIEAQHTSVLEHSSFGFIINGVSRALCYLPGTKILTKQGWLEVEKLKSGDQILTKCPQTGICRWSENKELLSMNYNGEIHWFENSEWKSPGITSDHLVWAAMYDKRRCRNKSSREIADLFSEKIPYHLIQGKRFVVDHEIRTEGEDPKNVIIGNHSYESDLFFEWLGWCLTDGGASKSRKKVYVTQSKQEGWDRISLLMDSLFSGRWRCCHSKRQDQKVASISDKNLWAYICENFGRLKSSRRLDFLFKYSRRILSCFLKGVIGGDGNVHQESGHTVVYCNNKKMAEDIQVISSMCGFSGCIRVFSPSGRSHFMKNGNFIKSNNDELLVSLHKGTASLVSKNHQHKIWYSGMVHCPKTEDGLVYVCRDGHGVWSGNTHELVRHRIGASFSQLSQRYVDQEEIGFVVPMNHIEAHESAELQKKGFEIHIDWDHWKNRSYLSWLGSTVNSLANYKSQFRFSIKLAEEQGLTGTEARKFARQHARYVLPECTNTMIYVTFNAQAWRHFIYRRWSKHADKEICRLAGVIRDILVHESPNIFSDMEYGN